MTDKEKRKQIMQRSIKLGHCICNPKQPCPCDLFKQENVCLCAGERLEDMPDNIPLTQLVENAGCASKINQTDLKIVLAGLPAISDPKVLVSADTCDDAGVYKLTDDLALVLKHLIVSHHGIRDFGSPEPPKTLEAIILNYLDELDAKVTAVRTFMEAEDPEAPWTSYHRVLERFFFRGKVDSGGTVEGDRTEAKEDRRS